MRDKLTDDKKSICAGKGTFDLIDMSNFLVLSSKDLREVREMKQWS